MSEPSLLEMVRAIRSARDVVLLLGYWYRSLRWRLAEARSVLGFWWRRLWPPSAEVIDQTDALVDRLTVSIQIGDRDRVVEAFRRLATLHGDACIASVAEDIAKQTPEQWAAWLRGYKGGDA